MAWGQEGNGGQDKGKTPGWEPESLEARNLLEEATYLMSQGPISLHSRLPPHK
jgi:hypothetical protein